MEDWMTCLYAFVGCGAFCFIFEMRRWKFILCAAGIGMVARAVCLLLSDMGGISQLVLATIVTATLAEIFARVLKTPATVLLIIGIIPPVPGDMAMFARFGLETVASAGAIAVGSSLVSAVTRILMAQKSARP